MRSLLLSASWAPAIGGVETLLGQTSRRLAEPPLVLAAAPAAAAAVPPADAAVPPADTAVPLRAVRLGFVGRASYRPLWAAHPSLHYLLTFLRPAARAVRTWRPRVILAGHVYLAPLAWLLARRTRRPFVVFAYGQEVWRAGRPMGQPRLDDALRGGALRAAAAVLVPGRFTAGLLDDWGVAPERIACIPFGAEPRPPVSPSSGASLLSVARLVPRKGIDTVIASLPRLASHVEYRVVGRGPDEARLRRLAETVGVAERVHFLGRVDEAQLAAEYQRCALFVLPARRTADGQLEGYGLVYFEAAAWGRAVVAGRSGGEVDAVVDGQTGLLVDARSMPHVAHAISTLLADPARRTALGAAGRARVATTHNWQQAAAAVDAILERLA